MIQLAMARNMFANVAEKRWFFAHFDEPFLLAFRLSLGYLGISWADVGDPYPRLLAGPPDLHA